MTSLFSFLPSVIAAGRSWYNSTTPTAGPNSNTPNTLSEQIVENIALLQFAKEVRPNPNPAKLRCDGSGEVNEFLDKNAFVTRLHLMAWRGHNEAVKVLLDEKHANPLIRDYLGRTPLTIAVEFDRYDGVMETLIKAHEAALGTLPLTPDYFFYFRDIPSHVDTLSDPLQNADERAFGLLMNSRIPVDHYSAPHTRFRQAQEILTRYVTGKSSLSKEETIKRLDFLIKNGLVNYGHPSEILNSDGKFLKYYFWIFLKTLVQDVIELQPPVKDLLNHLVTISKDTPHSKRVIEMHEYLASKLAPAKKT